MKILLHQCCGPCSVYPVRMLTEQDHSIMGYWYNPNIHPVTEFYKRLETLSKFNDDNNIKTIIDEDYGLVQFVRDAAFRESERCRFCYQMRIEKAAQIAKKGNFDAFTTTLMYSKWQDHEMMKEFCELASKKYGIPFHYEDYREGWQEGIDRSKEMGMYRQQYCGCIYSEEERYRKQLSKRLAEGKDIVNYLQSS